jgi:1-phosphofructokinase
MIVTVTFNPSLDRTMAFQSLVRGEVQRADSTLEDPGGKGVNVTRFVTARGGDSVAVLPAGGPMGHALTSALDEAEIPYRAIPIHGRTRANVAVVEPDGTTTKLNEAGPVLSDSEVDALVAAVAELATEGGWVAVAGSLPTGQSTDVVTRVAEAARAAGSKFALDISGQALADGLLVKPDLIKPNEEELGEILGRELVTIEEVVSGCEEARALGAGAVICSLGAKGAVLVDADGTWHGTGPKVPVVSTVGAGDSVLSGFLYAGGGGPEALRAGIAWGTAAVQTPGTGVPDASLIDVDSVEVSAIGT